ncbi:MAG TPA: hypothetical protein VFW50_38665 [Streptosporangiaceae bacterium]|nr:hypothetical protein [Streptosporangiaceae bacterium]
MRDSGRGVVVPAGLAGLWTWLALSGCIAVAWRWFGLGPEISQVLHVSPRTVRT